MFDKPTESPVMIVITKKCTGRRKDWGQIHPQLEIFFADRFAGAAGNSTASRVKSSRFCRYFLKLSLPRRQCLPFQEDQQ
jgi:hypothetical protein